MQMVDYGIEDLRWMGFRTSRSRLAEDNGRGRRWFRVAARPSPSPPIVCPPGAALSTAKLNPVSNVTTLQNCALKTTPQNRGISVHQVLALNWREGTGVTGKDIPFFIGIVDLVNIARLIPRLQVRLGGEADTGEEVRSGPRDP